jgi:hypothetical protein
MFFSTLQFRPEAAMAWGLAMLYGGAVLFLASVRTKWMVSLSVISLLTITGLPFMPTHFGLGLYSPPNLFVYAIPLAHAALLFGYLRHGWRQTDPLRGVERWVHLVYPIGLVLLPATYVLSALFSPEIPGTVSPPLWPIFVYFVIAAVVGFLYWKKFSVPTKFFSQLDRVFSLRWLYPLLGGAFRFFGRMGREISLLLEGEGGVLWALVLLVLLVSVLSQVAAGMGAV